MGRLQDHVAVVTGAAGGIGQQMSVALAREGATLVLVDLGGCENTVAEIEGSGGQAVAFQGDVSDAAGMQSIVDQAVERFGRVDALINNAAMLGGGERTDFDQIDESQWDKVMAVNVKGVWNCCKAVVPQMKQQGRGRIVNISSMTIWMGMPYLLHYSASKGAVLTLTRSLSRELQGTGICVNGITPGYHATDAAQSLAGADFETSRLRMLEKQIVKRTGTASDLNGAAVFLASDESEFITGQFINVDGGISHH